MALILALSWARKVPTYSYSPIDVYIGLAGVSRIYLFDKYPGRASWGLLVHPAVFGQQWVGQNLLGLISLSRSVGRWSTVGLVFRVLQHFAAGCLRSNGSGPVRIRHTLSIIALRTTKIFCESHSGIWDFESEPESCLWASYPDQIDRCPHGVVCPFFFGPQLNGSVPQLGWHVPYSRPSRVSCRCPGIVNCSGRTCWKVACQKWAI